MTGLSAALPRVKARRRKRRRPTHDEWFAMVWCGEVVLALGMVWGILPATHAPAWAVVPFVLLTPPLLFGLVTLWPLAWNYIVNGFEDE